MKSSIEKQFSLSESESVTGIYGQSTSPISSSAANQDIDDSYEVYKQSNDIEILPEKARRVLRKIDVRVMPVLFFTYMLQYLDKNSINFASVYRLLKDTHLHGQDYSWLSAAYPAEFCFFKLINSAGSIFCFGYLTAQYPAGYAMQKLPLGKFLASATIGVS